MFEFIVHTYIYQHKLYWEHSNNKFITTVQVSYGPIHKKKKFYSVHDFTKRIPNVTSVLLCNINDSITSSTH